MYYLLIIAGGLMTMDTIWLSTVCNGNLGTALPAIMGVPLLLIGLFRGFFIQWFRTPAGHIAKVLLIVCYSAAVVFFCCMGAMLGSAAHRKADYAQGRTHRAGLRRARRAGIPHPQAQAGRRA